MMSDSAYATVTVALAIMATTAITITLVKQWEFRVVTAISLRSFLPYSLIL